MTASFKAVKIVRYNVEILGVTEDVAYTILGMLAMQGDARVAEGNIQGDKSYVVATNLNELTYKRISEIGT